MKTLITTLLLTASVFAENTTNGFESAAQKYDAKAKAAQEAGNANDAEIYQKLAAIKRDAARADGKYDWSEYHALSAQLGNKTSKKHTKKGATCSFEEAAKKYDKLAKSSAADGNTEQAAIYTRMAAIKREAASAKGKYDWSEYHQLEAQLK